MNLPPHEGQKKNSAPTLSPKISNWRKTGSKTLGGSGGGGGGGGLGSGIRTGRPPCYLPPAISGPHPNLVWIVATSSLASHCHTEKGWGWGGDQNGQNQGLGALFPHFFWGGGGYPTTKSARPSCCNACALRALAGKLTQNHLPPAPLAKSRGSAQRSPRWGGETVTK